MDRVPAGGYAALIEAACSVVPPRILELLQPDYLCGVDPQFVGLHDFTDASYGRSYSTTMHVAYPHHQMKVAKVHRRTTIVIPVAAKRIRVAHLVHELGHVLHGVLQWEHDTTPVTQYGGTNWCEAFAEAFTSWLTPGYGDYPEPRTVNYLEALAAGSEVPQKLFLTSTRH